MPPDLVVLGNLIMDDLVFPDGRTRMGQPGGARRRPVGLASAGPPGPADMAAVRALGASHRSSARRGDSLGSLTDPSGPARRTRLGARVPRGAHAHRVPIPAARGARLASG